MRDPRSPGEERIWSLASLAAVERGNPGHGLLKPGEMRVMIMSGIGGEPTIKLVHPAFKRNNYPFRCKAIVNLCVISHFGN